MQIVLRPAVPADREAIAEVYLASRREFVGFAPLAHSDTEIRQWTAGHLIPSGAVTVAAQEAQVVGFLALSREDGTGWIDQLYLTPGFTGTGVGSRLLDLAKVALNSPIRLYTFQANTGARRFYEQHGFRAIAFSDGTDNEKTARIFSTNGLAIQKLSKENTDETASTRRRLGRLGNRAGLHEHERHVWHRRRAR